MGNISGIKEPLNPSKLLLCQLSEVPFVITTLKLSTEAQSNTDTKDGDFKLFPVSPRPPPSRRLLTCSLFSCPSNSYYTIPLSLSGLSRPPQLLTAPLTHQAGSQLKASHLRFPLPGGPSPEVPGAPSPLPKLRYCPPILFKAAAPNFPSPHTLCLALSSSIAFITI